MKSLPLGDHLLEQGRRDQLFVIVLRSAGAMRSAAARVKRHHLHHKLRRPDWLTNAKHDCGHLASDAL